MSALTRNVTESPLGQPKMPLRALLTRDQWKSASLGPGSRSSSDSPVRKPEGGGGAGGSTSGVSPRAPGEAAVRECTTG